MQDKREKELLQRIEELENRLLESDQLIEAIKEGEVDAFAINSNNKSEIYTLHSGDYAYRILIEEFGEGAVNVTEDGLIVYTNPYFASLLKLSYEKVISRSIFDFIHADSKTKFNQLFKKALSNKTKGEINLLVNNEIIPVYISLTSLRPALDTIGIIFTDLTEKKKNEEVILNYQKDLENKNFELQRSNGELASFAYIASHDLQEPLRKIQTFASLILQKEKDNLSDYGKDCFNRMQLAAQRMRNLIDDLLTYSRTNTGELVYKKTDIKKIINEVTADLKEMIDEKNAIIEVGNLCKANVIPFQMKQLFTNLVSNSLKFSHPAKQINIKINSELADGKTLKLKPLFSKKTYCHITFSDNGIGFDAKYKDLIFEVFQRLHGNSKYTGTGIGLAIVKKIVENHKGHIYATSEVNDGATFHIYIPV